jgi:hypothetical protein
MQHTHAGHEQVVSKLGVPDYGRTHQIRQGNTLQKDASTGKQCKGRAQYCKVGSNKYGQTGSKERDLYI